ncbi:MAG: hypothetical protein AWU54_1190 [Candidatus Frackibacter sp. T328-2]|jgi:hypothetical protein|nr:MAG: hypothetical protein AWU54_1190 [Candidatus Frackibacter sp. T328-2]
MQEDPLGKILGAMRQEGKRDNPPSLILAEVVASPPDIIIKFNGIEVDKDNIYIADYLLKEYKRKFYVNKSDTDVEGQSGTLNMDMDTNEGSFTGLTKPKSDGDPAHLHDLDFWKTTSNKFKINDGVITLNSTLQPGDLVAVMPTYDRQSYFILARVVSM